MKHLFLLALAPVAFVLSGGPVAAQALTRVANLSITSSPLGLAASGSTVYLAGAGFTLDTYNLSQPSTPVRLSSVSANTPYPRRVIAGGTKAYVFGYGIGVSSSSGVQAFEMSQPATPALGGSAQLGPPDQYIAANGTLVCIANSTDATLRVYDANLKLLATVTTKSRADGVTLNGTAAYLQRGSEVDIYDLAVATAPVYVAGISGYIGAVSGSLGFGLNSSTLRVYDVSAPLQPVLKGSIANNGGTLLAASGNRVYTTGQYSEIGGSTSQLQAFDVSNPAAPALLATAAAGSTARALAANGNAVYLTDAYTLQAYTLTGMLAATAPAAPASSLYPNPAHGTLTLAQVPANTPVIIYDATGRICLQTTARATATLDISALPAGLYVARVGAATHRLLVE